MMSDPTKIFPASDLKIYPLGEQAVTIHFSDAINETVAANIRAFDKSLALHPFHGFNSTILAYGSLTVLYDLEKVATANLPGESCFDRVAKYLRTLTVSPELQTVSTTKTIEVPVCYGGLLGPDLTEVSTVKKLNESSVVQLHSSAIYTVYMIGFVPGFAYLGGMDARLSSPRKSQPRPAVPAGAVGIAGFQTGIYPMITPGGWQIIGQTPLELFDPNRDQPSLFKAGDQIQFKPIGLEGFHDYTKS